MMFLSPQIPPGHIEAHLLCFPVAHFVGSQGVKGAADGTAEVCDNVGVSKDREIELRLGFVGTVGSKL